MSLHDERERAGLHMDGSLTLNLETAKALREMMKWQGWIRNVHVDEFCEAYDAQFGQFEDRELYT
jgi:hypothetical protein